MTHACSSFISPPAAAAGTVTLADTLTVNRIGFGAMRLTGPGIWGEPRDAQLARRILRRAVELGVNFIDTADSYGPETNEQIIAAALHPYPPGLVVATKGGLTRPGPDRFGCDARPERLRAACEGSLRRLKVDCIDVYQLHAPDPNVPLEDSVGELVRLQSEGKIRYIGVSNVSIDQLRRAQQLTRIVSVQNRYNIEDRAHEPVLEECERAGIAFITWDPLGAARRTSEHAELRQIAHAHRLTINQAALTWLLDRSPVLLPIPGTSSLDHLEENVSAATLAAHRHRGA